MRRTAAVRFLAFTIVAAVAVMGPLTPLAHAQQPAQPAQPDLFKETLKAQSATDKSQDYYDAGAVAVNVFLIPGKTLTCLAGGLVGGAILAATLGSGYKAAAGVVNEGCGGKWVVKGDDLRQDNVSDIDKK